MPIKKSTSGLQLQFISDSGEIYVTSLYKLTQFIQNPAQKILQWTKYPNKVPEGKFNKAVLHDPTGMYAKLQAQAEERGEQVDSLSPTVQKELKEEKQYNKVVQDF